MARTGFWGLTKAEGGVVDAVMAVGIGEEETGTLVRVVVESAYNGLRAKKMQTRRRMRYLLERGSLLADFEIDIIFEVDFNISAHPSYVCTHKKSDHPIFPGYYMSALM